MRPQGPVYSGVCVVWNRLNGAHMYDIVYSPLPVLDESGGYQGLSDDKLQSLCTLAYSDNIDLQRSAALCFSEISEKSELLA